MCYESCVQSLGYDTLENVKYSGPLKRVTPKSKVLIYPRMHVKENGSTMNFDLLSKNMSDSCPSGVVESMICEKTQCMELNDLEPQLKKLFDY